SVTVDRAGLKVAEELARFVEARVLPGLGLDAATWWAGAAAIFEAFAPENRRLLDKRDLLQAEIDGWCAEDPLRARDPAEQGRFPSRSAPRMSIPRSRPWPDRSWSCRCSTRVSCSTRPMRAGAACMMRSTAPTCCLARLRPAAMIGCAARR